MASSSPSPLVRYANKFRRSPSSVFTCSRRARKSGTAFGSKLTPSSTPRAATRSTTSSGISYVPVTAKGLGAASSISFSKAGPGDIKWTATLRSCSAASMVLPSAVSRPSLTQNGLSAAISTRPIPYSSSTRSSNRTSVPIRSIREAPCDRFRRPLRPPSPRGPPTTTGRGLGGRCRLGELPDFLQHLVVQCLRVVGLAGPPPSRQLSLSCGLRLAIGKTQGVVQLLPTVDQQIHLRLIGQVKHPLQHELTERAQHLRFDLVDVILGLVVVLVPDAAAADQRTAFRCPWRNEPRVVAAARPARARFDDLHDLRVLVALDHLPDRREIQRPGRLQLLAHADHVEIEAADDVVDRDAGTRMFRCSGANPAAPCSSPHQSAKISVRCGLQPP